MRKAALLLAVSTLLCACGGSGGETLRLPDGPPEYRNLVEENVALAASFEPIESGRLTGDFPEAPVTYTGVIALAPSDGGAAGYTSAVSLTATFTSADAATIEGSALQFFRGTFDSAGNATSDGTEVSGELFFDSSAADKGVFDIAVSGFLAVDGASSGIASGTLDGSFVSSNGSDIVGLIGKSFAEDGNGLTFGGTATRYDTVLLAN